MHLNLVHPPVRRARNTTYIGGNTMDWNHDLRQRLRWLYGDHEARIETRGPDVDAWNRLGYPKD